MKQFLVYTGLRIGLFVGCYAIFAGVWVAIAGTGGGAFVWPFFAAVVGSSVLSFRLLRGPRERFAQRVQQRAERAHERLERARSSEDVETSEA